MGIATWIVLGLVVGVVAKVLMPGKDGGGLIKTVILGVAGAFVGGYAGSFFGWGSVQGFDLRSLALAVGGAMVVLDLRTRRAVGDHPGLLPSSLPSSLPGALRAAATNASTASTFRTSSSSPLT